MVKTSGFTNSLSLSQIQLQGITKSTSHARASSLPTASHPALTHVQDIIKNVEDWLNTIGTSGDRTAMNLCKGLTLIKSLYISTDDLLQWSYRNEVTKSTKERANSLLEDLVMFLDMFSRVGAAISTLNEHQLIIQHAMRRRKGERRAMEALLDFQCKKMNKEMLKLLLPLKSLMPEGEEQGELLVVFCDVKMATISVAGLLVSSLCWTQKGVMDKYMGMRRRGSMEGVKKMGEVYEMIVSALRSKKVLEDELVKLLLERMERLEECMKGLVCEIESICRCLIKTRVSILNMLSQY